MLRDEKIGTIAGRIFRDKTREIMNVGVYLRKRLSLTNSTNVDREEFVFGASGAVVLQRREMLEDVKILDEYFDESYFAFRKISISPAGSAPGVEMFVPAGGDGAPRGLRLA